MNPTEKNRKTWLLVLSAAGTLWGLAGLAMGFLCRVPALAPFFDAFWRPFFGTVPLDASTGRLATFLLGFAGAGFTGYALFFNVLVWIPLRRGESWAWWTVLAGIVVWFVLDEGYSLAFGVTLNVIGNAIALVWMLIPIFVLRPKRT